jgi:hypothetical protein
MTMILDGTQGITFPDTSKQYNSYYSFKNRIINGAMVIDQRNAGASVTINGLSDVYTIDRFSAIGQSADGVFTIARSSVAPAGFTNSLLATVTTADSSIGASQFYDVSQFIEGFNVADFGWGAAGAATVTLSFWVRSSVTGTFGGALRNGSFNRSYPFSYTISAANTWEYKTITVPGDTTGTWLTTNGIGMGVTWSLGDGSSRLSTAGAWAAGNFAGATGQTNLIATNGATFYITGVQLEKGIVATSFDYRPYGTELALCQRYYEKSYNADVAPATATAVGAAVGGTYDGGSIGVVQARFAVAKRATATVAVWGTDGTSNVVVDNANRTATITNIGMSGASITYAGNGNFLGYTQFTASAEL